MPILTVQAEDVDLKRLTANVNSAASSESAFVPESIPERGGGEKNEKPHGFSKKVAEQKKGKKKLGASAAVVLRYLCVLQRRYGKVIDGIRWNRINLDHISKQYSYLGRSTVDEIIGRLAEFGACEVRNMNRYFTGLSYDRTNCFHVPDKWMNMVEEEIRYFHPSVAQEVGIPAAAIFFNFMHWIGEWNEEDQQPCARLAPSVIKTLQPFSPATIKRALAELKIHEFIAPLDKTPLWYVVGAGYAGSSNPDKGSSIPDESSSFPDETGSKPDNNNSCSELKGPLEESSKEKPAASSFELPSHAESIHEATCNSSLSTPENGSDTASTPSRRTQPLGTFTSSDPTVLPTDNDPHSEIWSCVTDLQSLRDLNKLQGHRVEAAPSAKNVSLAGVVQGLATAFFSQIRSSTIFDWSELDDLPRTFEDVVTHFRRFIDQQEKIRSSAAYPVICFATLECVLGAILYRKKAIGDHDHYPHSIDTLQRATYMVSLEIHEVLENEAKCQQREELAKRRASVRNPDAHKEALTHLAPAEKMRVVRSAVRAMNKIGWIFWDHQHRTDKIRFGKATEKQVQRFFELNRTIAPRHLIAIIARGMEVFASRPHPQKHEYAKNLEFLRYTDACHLVNGLDRAVRDLEMTAHLGDVVFLNEAKEEQHQNKTELEVAA